MFRGGRHEFLNHLGDGHPGAGRLARRRINLRQAQEKAEIIAVARPLRCDILGSGPTLFGTMDLRRSIVLKGRLKEEELQGVSVAASGPESIPTEGEYIVFLDESRGHLSIIKMLPGTEENIDATKGEIRDPRSSPSRKGLASRASSSLRSPDPRPSVVDHLLFYPSPFPQGDWSIDESKFEDAWFRSANGARLNGWFAEARNPRAVVLFAEGNGGNITYRRDVLTRFRDRLNCSVFIFDYQGYGKSEGKPTREGILADARAARLWLSGRTGTAETDIVLVGESLGGAVAVDLAARDGARGLVLQSTFSSLADVTRQHFGRLAGRTRDEPARLRDVDPRLSGAALADPRRR